MKKVWVGIAVAVVAATAGVAYLRPELLQVGPPKVDYGLYCDEHGMPEKFCTLCHPKLKATLLLCEEHGNVPEDVCMLCHPESAKSYDTVACRHGATAHYCRECHPENFADDAAAAGAGVDDGWCETFGEGGDVCKTLPLVRLASSDLAEDVGLKMVAAVEEEHHHELAAQAETAYDANSFAEVVPRVRGYIVETRADLGDVVRAGDVLAVVDSSEVSTAKAQFLAADSALRLAEDVYGRMSTLAAQDVVPRKEELATRTALNQAKAALLEARQRLRNFLFDDARLEAILETQDTEARLNVVSPIDGTVVRRHAVLGEAVEPIADLFTVADVSRLWLWINVYERDVDRVRVGQTVRFTTSGGSAASGSARPAAEARITWVGADVDEKTRTTRVRAELPNPDALFRANQYGEARIALEGPHKAVVVAKSAVQKHEGVDLVFIDQGGAVYRPQRIKVSPLGRRDVVEVAWGLKPGQAVVADGSFLLKTEIMKGSIGAGCCE